jgi:hypothetical protein
MVAWDMSQVEHCPSMERRFAGLVLVAAGVAFTLGVGAALITAGVGLWVAGLDLDELRASAAGWARRAWLRARLITTSAPRRSAAAVLVGLGGLVLAAAAVTAAGPWAGLATFGGLNVVVGAALGWE